jgi:hypothetical protein
LRNADRGVLVQRLDDEREAHIARPLHRLAAKAHEEVRDAQPLVSQHHLGECLVARQHQSLGRGACVGQSQHLHQRGHAVVQARLVAEALGQVEHRVHRLGAQARHQRVKIIAEAEQAHIVALAPQRAGHVEFRLVRGFDLARVVLPRRRFRIGVEQD